MFNLSGSKEVARCNNRRLKHLQAGRQLLGARELHLKVECLLAVPFAPEPAVTRCITPPWHSSASNSLDLEPASSSN